MWPLIAGLAAGGLLKSELVDRPKEERERKMRAAEQRYSPWTGIAPSTQVQEADPFGSALQGGLTGASFGQNMDMADAQKDYMKAMTERMKGGGPDAPFAPAGFQSPWMTMNGYSR